MKKFFKVVGIGAAAAVTKKLKIGRASCRERV